MHREDLSRQAGSIFFDNRSHAATHLGWRHNYIERLSRLAESRGLHRLPGMFWSSITLGRVGGKYRKLKRHISRVHESIQKQARQKEPIYGAQRQYGLAVSSRSCRNGILLWQTPRPERDRKRQTQPTRRSVATCLTANTPDDGITASKAREDLD